MKKDSLVASRSSFSKLSSLKFKLNWLLVNDSIKQIFMVLLKGTLVNNKIMSRLAMKKTEICSKFSAAK